MSVRVAELATLYTSERQRLFRLIQRIVGSRAVVEDLAQDTFLKLTSHDVPAGRSLLFRTAQNLALDYLRAQRVRDAHAASASADEPVAMPEADFAAREELKAILEALQSLPERTQQVFLLNRLDGMACPQIAKALGISEGTARNHLVRAISFCQNWQKERSGG